MRMMTPIRSFSAAVALLVAGCGRGAPPAAPAPVAALTPPAKDTKAAKRRVARPYVPVRVGPGSVSQ